jgi:hypothetical protein
MLTAPDNSPLEVRQRGKTLGFIRWSPEVVGQNSSQKKPRADTGTEEMVVWPEFFTLSVSGNIAIPGISNQLRVDFDAVLTTNAAWREFTLRLGLRPHSWQFHSVAAEEMLHFKMEDGAETLEQDFKFAELQNPQALLREFGGPLPLALLADAGLPPAAASPANPLSLGLNWQARESWIRIGHSPVRVYRLASRLLDRYEIVLIISRAGEILKVQLPGDVILVNEQVFTP